MKNFYTTLLFFFSCTTFLYAQTNSLLWEITGNGTKDTCYLYGTIHVRDPRVFKFGDSLTTRYSKCQTYAGEVVMDPSMQKGAMKMIMMPGDTTLDMLLSSKDYKLVMKHAKKKLGLMAGAINRMKPIYVSALFGEPIQQKGNVKILDEYFQDIAKIKKMKVVGIEEVQEQLSAIDKIPLKEQASMLVEELKSTGGPEEGMEQLVNLYLSQDLDGLLKVMMDEGVADNFTKALIKDRNYVMADRIEKLIKSERSFIGIGAGHLPGDEGVIELLRKKGFKVTSVVFRFNY